MNEEIEKEKPFLLNFKDGNGAKVRRIAHKRDISITQVINELIANFKDQKES